MLVVQSNLAMTYGRLGRKEEALRMRRGVYTGTMKLLGKEAKETVIEANNYSSSLVDLKRFEEASSLLRKTIPVARRVLGNNEDTAFKMRWYYAVALYKDEGATLDDVRKAVSTLEETERISRRVMGGAHPLTPKIEWDLQDARAALRARETPASSA